MNACRIVCLSLLLIGAVSIVQADERDKKEVTISDKSFRQISSALLNDPRHTSARGWSRLILLYRMRTSSAAVVVGSEELHWVGLDDDDRHGLLLLAAYAAGNIQSQLNSGVKRNDRYSGLLTLFHVYRALREQDRKFNIAAVDYLLELHRQNKLVPHLQKLDEKTPTKLSPAEEKALRKLMKTP
ncbi:MAG: hypothetical protein ACRELF_16950 [Gemmataceae bacterium]